jgi:hypothetical protein
MAKRKCNNDIDKEETPAQKKERKEKLLWRVTAI